MTNDGMPTLATNTPMNRPSVAAHSIATTSARTQFQPCWLTSRTQIAIALPPVTPADRSISAMRMTNVSAIESIISAAVCVIRFAMFVFEKKTESSDVNRTPSTTRPAERGQAAHVAAAHALDVGAELVADRALVTRADQRLRVGAERRLGLERVLRPHVRRVRRLLLLGHSAVSSTSWSRTLVPVM